MSKKPSKETVSFVMQVLDRRLTVLGAKEFPSFSDIMLYLHLSRVYNRIVNKGIILAKKGGIND